MEAKELNRVQQYFTTIFAHDINDKDFKELQLVVGGWLASKIRETPPSGLTKHSNSNGRERTK